jgi:hypothetical protein
VFGLLPSAVRSSLGPEPMLDRWFRRHVRREECHGYGCSIHGPGEVQPGSR